jgi:hypothetical protein
MTERRRTANSGGGALRQQADRMREIRERFFPLLQSDACQPTIEVRFRKPRLQGERARVRGDRVSGSALSALARLKCAPG